MHLENNSTQRERELIPLIAVGDEAAFRELYDLHESRVYGTALGYLKSPDWARDIVQDVFLKIWLGRNKLPLIEKPGAFLFVMTRNEIMNALRNKWNGEPLPENYEEVLPDEMLLPDARLQLRQSEGIIQQAVDRLPQQQKRVYLLTREQGLSHEEVAAQLGIDKTTVSNHATRALNAIREFLKNQGEHLLSIFF